MILEENLCQEDYILWEILYQIDKEKFEKYILISAAKMIYKKVFKENQDWMKNLIIFLGFEYEFKENEMDGGIMDANIEVDIMETYLNTNLFEDIGFKFSEKNVEKLRKLGVITGEKANVALNEIEERDLLVELDIYEILEIFWMEVCKWKDRI